MTTYDDSLGLGADPDLEVIVDDDVDTASADPLGDRRAPTAATRVSWASPRPYVAPPALLPEQPGSPRATTFDPIARADARRSRWARPLVTRAVLVDALIAFAVWGAVIASYEVNATVVVGAVLCSAAWCLALWLFRAYDSRRIGAGPDEFGMVGRAAVAVLVTMSLVSYSLQPARAAALRAGRRAARRRAHRAAPLRAAPVAGAAAHLRRGPAAHARRRLAVGGRRGRRRPDEGAAPRLRRRRRLPAVGHGRRAAQRRGAGRRHAVRRPAVGDRPRGRRRDRGRLRPVERLAAPAVVGARAHRRRPGRGARSRRGRRPAAAGASRRRPEPAARRGARGAPGPDDRQGAARPQPRSRPVPRVAARRRARRDRRGRHQPRPRVLPPAAHRPRRRALHHVEACARWWSTPRRAAPTTCSPTATATASCSR
nr:hypothetical protein [Angustibacter aerolatus]